MALTPTARAGEPVDLEVVTAIRDEAFNRSQVMAIIDHLTEEIGPRITNSPQMTQANQWTRDKLEEWGLAKSKLEPWGEFGLGWSFSHASVHMVEPFELPLAVLPAAWTPGTEGTVQGKAMRLSIRSEKDMEKHKGKLAGAILFLDDAVDIERAEDPLFSRHSEEDLCNIQEYTIRPSRARSARLQRFIKRWKMRKKLAAYLAEEGVVATVRASSFYGGVLRGTSGGSWKKEDSRGVTGLFMGMEHYNRVLRLLDNKKEVTLSINVTAQFHDDDPQGYNTIAEIPGSDLKREVVMLGGHMDSWHMGTGATDNAAGVAVAMEAVRILKALGVKPRRTIRVALWSGEEQGLLGARGYVAEHFGARAEPEDPEQKELPSFARSEKGKLELKPDHKHFSAYFNLDNGAGKIRGIYTQGNVALKPIFEAWLKPFEDVGATTVSNKNTGGTDHLAFDSVGLPGFQFIQDELAYFTRTHHSNLDVRDHIVAEDLMQASAIMASFVYHTAMRPGKLPRKPLPKD